MIHSLLIVGGTRKKREIMVCRPVPDAPSGSSGLPARNVRVRSLNSYKWSRGSLSEARQTREPHNFDTITLEPEEDKQTISIDQIRDLQHQLSLKPYAAECKTGIILEAQRLTTEAQNALLKTLEEPPAQSVLILTAPSAKQLLPTVVSRCQIAQLPAEIDLDLESEEYKKGVEEFLTLLQQGRGELLAWVENNNKSLIVNRESLINMLNVWLSVLRDLLLLTSGCPTLTLTLNSSILSSMKEFNNLTIEQFNHSVKSISLCSSILLTQKTKNLIASTNVSPRLALEVLFLDLPIFSNPKG